MPDGGARARARLRMAGALLFGAGAVTVAAVLVAPDPDTSDHAALAACALVYSLACALLVLWRTPPTPVLHAICPAGTIATTAAVAFAEPIGAHPDLLPVADADRGLLPLRREVAANFAFALASCGIALALWADPVLRLASFMAVSMIVGVATAVVVVLREHVLELVMRLRVLASHDSLTGALNRGAFEQRLDAELARAQRTGAELALVIFDVDHFKAINDSFGHAAGDAALRSIGDEVARSMRRSDVFGRLGGEEFALMLPDTDIDGAAVVADKLRLRFAESGSLTVSFGVAQSARDASAMLQEADRALYAAKRRRPRPRRALRPAHDAGAPRVLASASASRPASDRAPRGTRGRRPRGRAPCRPARRTGTGR